MSKQTKSSLTFSFCTPMTVNQLCWIALATISLLSFAGATTVQIKFKVDEAYIDSFKTIVKDSIKYSVGNYTGYHNQAAFAVKTKYGHVTAASKMKPTENVELRGRFLTYRLKYEEIQLAWDFTEFKAWTLGIYHKWGKGKRSFDLTDMTINVTLDVSAKKSANNEISMQVSTTSSESYEKCVAKSCRDEGCDWNIDEKFWCNHFINHTRDKLKDYLHLNIIENSAAARSLKLENGLPSKFIHKEGSHIHYEGPIIKPSEEKLITGSGVYWNVELKKDFSGRLYVFGTFSTDWGPKNVDSRFPYYDVEFTYKDLNLNDIVKPKMNMNDIYFWRESIISTSDGHYKLNLDIYLEGFTFATSTTETSAKMQFLISEAAPQRNKLYEYPNMLKKKEFDTKHLSWTFPILLRPSFDSSRRRYSMDVSAPDVNLDNLVHALRQSINVTKHDFEAAMTQNLIYLSNYISSLDIQPTSFDVTIPWSSEITNHTLRFENIRGSMFDVRYSAKY